jgi:hypothetical protein
MISSQLVENVAVKVVAADGRASGSLNCYRLKNDAVVRRTAIIEVGGRQWNCPTANSTMEAKVRYPVLLQKAPCLNHVVSRGEDRRASRGERCEQKTASLLN